MREILFRGKTDKGEWVEGGIIPLDVESGYVFIAEPFLSATVYEIIKHHTHLVIPSTIGQYTGLTDKNGTKIFEGDICQTKGYKLIDEIPFVIVWNDFYSGWYWEDVKNANDTDMLTKSVAELTEVIGNIHDNPELLGGD